MRATKVAMGRTMSRWRKAYNTAPSNRHTPATSAQATARPPTHSDNAKANVQERNSNATASTTSSMTVSSRPADKAISFEAKSNLSNFSLSKAYSRTSSMMSRSESMFLSSENTVLK